MERLPRPPRWPRLRAALARATFRDVVLFTLPPFLFAAWFLIAPILDYGRARQFDDWWSAQAHVHRFAGLRARALLDLPKSVAHERRLDPASPTAGSLRIFVDRSEFDRVQGNALEHMDTWVEAQLLRGSDWRPVEIRLRGDGSVHWTTEKKSLTVKTPRAELYEGWRRMILSVKTVLPQYVVGRLARDMGVLAPRTEVLPVYLNDRFWGVHRLVEPVDESFLRRADQMPGNVWRADRAERGEYMKGLARGVFKDPDLWDRAAQNDRPGAGGDRALDRFLADLAGTTFPDHLRFLEWIDPDEIARFLAVCLIAGDPWHMSAIHNQLWYEEPASGRMHPIVWDLRLLDLTERPEPLNPFWQAALRDPRILARTLEVLHEEIEERDVAARGERLARAAYARCENELDYDRLRRGRISDVGHPAEVTALLRKNVETLRGWMGEARAAFRADALDPGVQVVDFEVDGLAGVELVGFAVDDAALEASGIIPVHSAFQLFADSNLSGALETAVATAPSGGPDRALSGRLTRSPYEHVRREDGGYQLLLDRPVALLPGTDTTGEGLAAAPMAYRFFLTFRELAAEHDMEELASFPALRPVVVNRLTGAPIDVRVLAPGARLAAGESFHPWRYPEPEWRELSASGDVRIERDLVIPAGTTWVVKPGTTVRLAPDASILARGRIDARGTVDAPIRFERMDPARPWGTLALQDGASAGSRFEHCQFDGGGGAFLDRVEYKGMVCAHWTRDVRFESCHFTGNVRCDDAVNVVQSAGVDLANCRFQGVNADAIDYDHSTGTISGCVILESGNDGIDLMSCSPRIIACVIRDSGDKGISIGEDARPLVFANRIEGCVRGVEVKDASEPLLLCNEITGNDVGVLAQAKNWRYGDGGWPRLVSTRVAGNGTDVELDARSGIGLLRSAIGDRLAAPGPGSGPDPVRELAHARGLLLPAELEPGLPPDWRVVAPPELVWAVDFREADFARPTAGWGSTGGVTRLETSDRCLEARVRRTTGRIGTLFESELANGTDGRLLLEIEYATANLAGARLALAADVSRELALTGSERAFRIAAWPLEAGALGGLALDLDPGARSDAPGILRLRAVRIWRRAGEDL